MIAPGQAQPVFGLPLRWPSPDGRPLTICRLRPLRSLAARQAVDLLEAAWPRWDRAGQQLAAITEAEPALAHDLVPRRLLRFPLLLDPTGQLSRQLGLEHRPLRPQDYAHPRLLLGLPALFGAGRGGLGWAGGQLGAELVMNGEGELLHLHRHEHPWDLPDIEALARAAGI